MPSEPLARLVDRWTSGWAVSRGVPREPIGEAWRVPLAASSRAVEYVVGADAAGILRDLTGGSETWFTVVGEHGPLARPLPRLEHAEAMMAAALTLGESVAQDHDVVVHERGQVGFVEVSIAGRPAARGQVAVVGDDAVFDRIQTEPEFRRRGLGRTVMTALGDWALAHGATAGLLVASSDGQKLYESLGWTRVAPVATYALGASTPLRPSTPR